MTSPAGHIAATVAKAMAGRGDDVGPNVTLVLLAELEATQVLLESRDQRIKEAAELLRQAPGYDDTRRNYPNTWRGRVTAWLGSR